MGFLASIYRPTSNKKRCFTHHFLLLFWANLDLIPKHYAVMLVRLRVSEPLASAVRIQRTGTSAPQARRIYAPAEGIFRLILATYFSTGHSWRFGRAMHARTYSLSPYSFHTTILAFLQNTDVYLGLIFSRCDV